MYGLGLTPSHIFELCIAVVAVEFAIIGLLAAFLGARPPPPGAASVSGVATSYRQ
jgi:hypothetical protein